MLDRLISEGHLYAPEYGGGLSNHFPMSLIALARLRELATLPPEVLTTWADSYRARLELGPFSDKYGFVRALENRDPLLVVRETLEQFGDGLAGTAGHALLRIYFSLEAQPLLSHSVFLAELARSLDYFVQGYTRLGPISRHGQWSLSAALAESKPIADREHNRISRIRSIVARQAEVACLPEFAALVDRVAVAEPTVDSLIALASCAARNTDFTLLHALTTGHALLEIFDRIPLINRAPLSRGWIDFVAAAWLTQRLSWPDSVVSGTELDPAWKQLRITRDDHAPKAAFALHRLCQRSEHPAFAAALSAYVAAYG